MNNHSGFHSEINYHALSDILRGRDVGDGPCPLCGPDRQQVFNRKRKVLRAWRLDDGVASFYCPRCGARGVAFLDGPRLKPDRAMLAKAKAVREADDLRRVDESRAKVAALYSRAVPVTGTLGEVYWREHRSVTHPLPRSMRFLADDGVHPATILIPFGLPGGKPTGLHMTSLDGEGRKLRKITLGLGSTGWPLVMSPALPGQRLFIDEGPENALTLVQLFGGGAWAAGSKDRLPKLAARLPHGVEVVVRPDIDADGGGLARARELVVAAQGRGLAARLLEVAP